MNANYLSLYKLKTLLTTATLCILIFSCKKDDLKFSESTQLVDFNSQGYIVENGYLNFKVLLPF